jgi:DnaJ-class molecular chaperone
MQVINEAYQVLRDPTRRAHYDLYRKAQMHLHLQAGETGTSQLNLVPNFQEIAPTLLTQADRSMPWQT